MIKKYCLFFILFLLLLEQPLQALLSMAEPLQASSDLAWPCHGHGCGCDTAEACRKSCCCVEPKAVKKILPSCGSCEPEPKVAATTFDSFLRRQSCRGNTTRSQKDVESKRVRLDYLNFASVQIELGPFLLSKFKSQRVTFDIFHERNFKPPKPLLS
jgi:hypothetical protein